MKLPKLTVTVQNKNESNPQLHAAITPQGICEVLCHAGLAACIAAGGPPMVCNAALAACLAAC